MADEIRALTVRQPFAHMIAHCGKLTENRPKPTRFRGLIAIHAGAYSRWDRDGETDPRCRLAWREWSRTLPPMNVTGPLRKDAIHITFGAVIAVAEITGCHHSVETDVCLSFGRHPCSPWASLSAYHWQLANVRPLSAPVSCRGMLGLWRLPPGAEQAVRAQLEAGDG